ncbi:MAG: phosphoribosyl-AMP cyclohydrolase [Deltaproteobacteria bacterium]|nr:phosphoribosyl-AMP cyclohydrolase [Deltaproteobacteria bacterium]
MNKFEPLIGKMKFDTSGLIPAVIQDVENNEVLMVAYMNQEAVKKTLEGPYVTFYSRSRNKMWIKGETSGHTQEVKEVYYDCDADCLLVKVVQKVAACHEGYRSCFFRKIENGESKIIAKKLFEEEKVYKK